MTIGRVGSAATSTNPVTNVPRIAPAVPSAESRPTTEPVSPRLRSWSLTTIGLAAESTAAGAKNTIAVIVTTPNASGRNPIDAGDVDERDDREREDPADDEHRPQQAARVRTVGRAPAEPGADRDAGKDGADDRRSSSRA